MKKIFIWIFSILYIVIMGYVSFYSMPELTIELFNNNKVLLLLIGIIFNTCMLLINIVVMGFIFRIIYKLSTKVTLESKENNGLTYKLLIPIFFTHMLVLVLIKIFSINTPLILLLFLNPLIFVIEYKIIDSSVSGKKKIVCIIPFAIYAIIDMVNIYLGIFNIVV